MPEMMVIPVALPPGRGRLATSPSFVGSPPITNTIGIEVVAVAARAELVDVGLIYRVDVDDERNVAVDMTLTAPGCPVAGEMPVWVENAVASVPGVKAVTVNMVFDPPWDQSRMSDEARVALDMW